jgi:hypothetical protein
MMAYGEWKYNSTFHDLSFMFLPLILQGKMPRYPLNRRLVGVQDKCGRWGVYKNYFFSPGFELRTPNT